ncbi:MAG: TIGR02206 family membrane protein [Actinomycetia bacterium]|nr:TIGR02206 family membrane protein [Actinomycetes bacterium]
MDDRTVLVADEFVTFGSMHFAALGAFAVGAVGMVLAGRHERGADGKPLFGRVFAVLIPVVTVPLQIAQLLPSEWNFDTSLPLQLCDFAWIVATVALWTRRRWAVALTYFWGLTLTTQGLATPDLGSNFPEPRFLMYWAMHLLIVWAALYLTFGLGLGPTWREYRISVLVTFVWAVAMFTFNVVTGANYGFLNRKPNDPSILDVLGPWPLYVFVEIALVLAVWALMTWPWVAWQRRLRTLGRTDRTTAKRRPPWPSRH